MHGVGDAETTAWMLATPLAGWAEKAVGTHLLHRCLFWRPDIYQPKNHPSQGGVGKVPSKGPGVSSSDKQAEAWLAMKELMAAKPSSSPPPFSHWTQMNSQSVK